MSILSGLISTATNAVGTNENAQANAAKSNMAAALQRAQLQRQDQQDLLQQAIQAREAHSQELKDQLTGVQTEAERYKVAHPLIDPNSPDVFARKTQMEHDKIDYDRTNGYHAPVQSFQFMQGTDAQGNPVFVKGNKQSGELQPTDVGGKISAAGGGAAGGMNDVRIETARQQAASAEGIMHQFEEDLLAGHGNISMGGSSLAKVALNGGPVESAAAEYALNKSNPRLAQYVRAAKQFATAERLITPRGGSNAMMAAEALLSQAGPSPTPELIQQARQYRSGFSTGVGGHAKPTPHQGNAAPTGGASHAPVLSDEDRAHAQRDPEFAAWLQGQGYKQ